jgi:hypothetical protein
MCTLNAQGMQNVTVWCARAHAFKVTRAARRCAPYVSAANQLIAPLLCPQHPDALKVFMVGASSDCCDFAVAMTRRAEVAGVVSNAIELLGSWEPAQHVRERCCLYYMPAQPCNGCSSSCLATGRVVDAAGNTRCARALAALPAAVVVFDSFFQ